MPLHGRSKQNLEKLCSGWDGIGDPVDFRAPQVTIATASFKSLQEWATLEIEGRVFNILIQEIEANKCLDQGHATVLVRPNHQNHASNFSIFKKCVCNSGGSVVGSQSIPTGKGDRVGSSASTTQNPYGCHRLVEEETSLGIWGAEDQDGEMREEEVQLRIQKY